MAYYFSFSLTYKKCVFVDFWTEIKIWLCCLLKLLGGLRRFYANGRHILSVGQDRAFHLFSVIQVGSHLYTFSIIICMYECIYMRMYSCIIDVYRYMNVFVYIYVHMNMIYSEIVF